MWHLPPSALVCFPGWPVGKSPPGTVEILPPNTTKYKYNLSTTMCRKPSFLTWFPVPLRCWMEMPEFRGSTGRFPFEMVISTWTGVRGRLKPRKPPAQCFVLSHVFLQRGLVAFLRFSEEPRKGVRLSAEGPAPADTDSGCCLRFGAARVQPAPSLKSPFTFFKGVP